MNAPLNQQWLRKVGLIVTAGEKALDLSEMRIRFQVSTADFESPDNCSIRVYNLSASTVKQIRGEYNGVSLEAGYQNGSFGTIFTGTIKQFRIGRESATDSYLDILASDNDIGYSLGVVQKTFAAGSSMLDVIKAAAGAMNVEVDSNLLPLDLSGPQNSPAGLNPIYIRGKVGFGMARAMMRNATNTIGSTWAVKDGKLQIIPLTGFLPGEAVVLNFKTGMIGIPEQTDGGIRVRALLNPKFRVGGLIQLNNEDVAQIAFTDPVDLVAFNSWKQQVFAAKVVESTDGLYRLLVAEHIGDIRGPEWYSDLTCLAVNQDTQTVAP